MIRFKWNCGYVKRLLVNGWDRSTKENWYGQTILNVCGVKAVTNSYNFWQKWRKSLTIFWSLPVLRLESSPEWQLNVSTWILSRLRPHLNLTQIENYSRRFTCRKALPGDACESVVVKRGNEGFYDLWYFLDSKWIRKCIGSTMTRQWYYAVSVCTISDRYFTQSVL